MPVPSVSTSFSLISRVQQFEPEAWSRFSRLYAPLVYSWARRVHLQDSDAADVVQDVFQAIARDVRRFRIRDSGSSFRGWLWGITRHKLLDFQRRSSRQPTASGGSEADQLLLNVPDAPPNEETPEMVESKIVTRALKLIQVDFHETTWQAFWRVTIDGEAPEFVATSLGISKGAVYTAKSRVLTHLRSEFKGILD